MRNGARQKRLAIVPSHGYDRCMCASSPGRDSRVIPWPEQTILVTGAARRLGRALVEAIAAQGAAVIIHYHRAQREAEDLAESVRGRATNVTLMRADLRQPEEQERLASDVLASCDSLTGLVNNASLYTPTPLESIERSAWDEQLAVNLTAPVWLAQRLGRAMRAGGSGAIVNIGDWSTHRPYRNYLAYTVSKGALETATRALARELAPEVRVNMVALGPMLLPEGSDPDLEARVSRAVPLGRVGTPREYVAAVLHLLSASTYSTGAIIVVDGGRSLI
jgi:pteridine reductase